MKIMPVNKVVFIPVIVLHIMFMLGLKLMLAQKNYILVQVFKFIDL